MAYVIVGASASGINAAKTLRENDKNIEIILVSKDEYVKAWWSSGILSVY